MYVTIKKLKENLSEYLYLSLTEDIYITKNGKVISKLTSPFNERMEIAKSLFGIIPDSISLGDASKERLENI